MFDLRKFGQLLVLPSVFLGVFLTVLSAKVTNDVVRIEKLAQQPSVVLASSNTEKQANVQLEELEPRMLSDGKRSIPDGRFSFYNRHLRALKLLASKGKSIRIHTEDNDVRRLLKQQLNNALEIYHIVGQLLDAGDPDVNLFAPSTLPAIQVLLAESNLAINPDERALANKVCLKIAQEWHRDNIALETAGVGTRLDVLRAIYYQSYCVTQRLKLEKNSLSSSAIIKSQPQQRNLIELEEIDPIRFRGSIEELPIENREHAQQFIQKYNQIIKPLIGVYNANIRLLQLVPRRQSLEIRTEDRDFQKVAKYQLAVAIELNRIQGLRLSAGLLTDNPSGGSGIISNYTSEIMLPAIQIALGDMNSATKPKDRAMAIETGLKIARDWEKNAVVDEKTTLHKRFVTLTARYWRRHFEIHHLLTESNSRG